jgi:isopentenyldiphosphate isomerase
MLKRSDNGCILDSVDYILFLTADVTVTPNLNEIRDYKYVSKEELQAMFEDPCRRLIIPCRKVI